jgi:two-component system sensor kinase FixL
VLSALLWIVFGPASADNHDQFYIFFLPIIWIAVRRGLRGATAGILILDLGIVVSLSHFHGDSAHFAVLQLLMLILSLAGLVLDSLTSVSAIAAKLASPAKKNASASFSIPASKAFAASICMAT